MSDKNSAIELYKNLVNSNKNAGTIVTALKNAFEVDKQNAINWFIELSESEKANWFYIENTILELLPQIVNVNKNSGVQIFSNLLKPDFEKLDDIIEDIRPMRHAQRGHDLWAANKIIVELFDVAPKEFFKIVLELVLQYQDIPIRSKGDKIYDVMSAIWYYDDPHYVEINLLKSIENESKLWAKNNDSRLKEVFEYLESTPYSISIRIQSNIMLSNPKLFARKLFQLTEKIIQSNDCIDLLPLVLSNIADHLSKLQIDKMNNLILNHPLPDDFLKDEDGSYRKFLALSIPKNIRNHQSEQWLQDVGIHYPDLRLRERPIVFTSYEDEPKQEKKDFEKLTDVEQEKELIDLINKIETINEKDQKLDFLRVASIFLNKNKDRVNKSIILKLEPMLREFCNDIDPEGTGSGENIPTHGSLISYPTVRAYAASCMLKLAWHRPDEENISIIKKLSEDKHTFVREEVCRNLRFLSSTNYPISYEIATNYLNDNDRLHFFLTDFLNFNVRTHTKDIFELCQEIITRYAKLESKENQSLLEFVVNLVTQMALKFDDEYFTPLFYKLVEDNSYNYTVKHMISFVCKSNNILLDKQIEEKVLHVYHKLIESGNQRVRIDAEFFLFHTLIEEKVSFLPKIKPLLQTLSNLKYEISSTDYFKTNLIDYIEKFWDEMPDEFVIYLHRIYSNNVDLVYNFHKSREVIKLLQEMYQSDKTSHDSKNKLMVILLEFVKASWPEASEVLRKIEGSM